MERKLVTVAEFAKSGPISESTLRWIRFNGDTNGANDHGVFVSVLRRVYIDPAAWERWVDSQNQRGAA